MSGLFPHVIMMYQYLSFVLTIHHIDKNTASKMTPNLKVARKVVVLCIAIAVAIAALTTCDYATTATARRMMNVVLQTDTKRSKCMISSCGSDGVGHQLEAKLSCIATAAALAEELEYIHTPMTIAEHGVDPKPFEALVGIPAQHNNNSTRFDYQNRPRSAIGNCMTVPFESETRNEDCQKHSDSTVFVSDNCWDFFYCELEKGDPKIKKRMEEALAQVAAAYMQKNQKQPRTPNDPLSVVVHMHRGDGKRTHSGYYANLIRGLVDASTQQDDRLKIIIHTDQANATK
jgi:hypothetical protein